MNFKALGENLGLEEDEYRELIELFVDTGTDDYQRMRAALAAADFDQMSRIAHTIKGAAGNLGLSDIQGVAGALERGAEAQNPDGMAEALQTLAEQFKAMAACIRD